MQRVLFRYLHIVCARSTSRFPPFGETIRITPDIRPLYKAVKQAPHLLSYVRNLAFCIHGDSRPYEVILEAPSFFLQNRVSKTWYRYLLFIINGLTGVEKLTFNNELPHPLITHCPNAVRDSLSSLLRRPTLKSLYMTHGSALELLTLLSEGPQIVNLALGNIYCAGNADLSLYPRVPELHLDTLQVSGPSYSFLRLLNRELPSQASIRINRLKGLRIFDMMIAGDSSAFERTRDLLMHNKDTLRYLALSFHLNSAHLPSL